MRTEIVPNHMTEEDVSEFRADIEQLRKKFGQPSGTTKKYKTVRRRMYLLEIAAFATALALPPYIGLPLAFVLYFLHHTQWSFFAHVVQHGTWSSSEKSPKEARNSSMDFPWIEQKSWKAHHNGCHHVHTNIWGVDPDTDFKTYRLRESIPHKTKNRIQMFWVIIPFVWQVAVFHVIYGRGRKAKDLMHIAKAFVRTLLRMSPHIALMPAISYVIHGSWAAPLAVVLVSTFLANLIIGFVLLSGHLYNCDVFKDVEPKSFEEWALLQIQGSNNLHFKGRKLNRLLCEFTHGLSLQVEHHLFPQAMPDDLLEAREEVMRICEKHNIKYNSVHYLNSLIEVPRRLIKYSVP